ncbi:MAG: ABC transporter ATP-binding protein [Gemmatimonadales bacterium]|nr:ABC transporter ATP-binding protein [Gemmatimonadales bacterium]
MPIVEFSRVAKSFGSTRAVDDLSFAIERGEFFSLLGPSGCGKTTTLRLLAGLEAADTGDIRIHGERANQIPPYERKLGMVFQSYALFPHLTVARNVAFGLERRQVPGREIPGRVARALETVRLEPAEFGPRRPIELSGGQRQRVALARALVLEPDILLLDEPLGAIDLKLRRAMQLELKQLNRSLGVTFVYVTHDQDEALAMSDRIAVMHGGRIVQIGSPAETYENPRTEFVATFIGESNLFSGHAIQRVGSEWEVASTLGTSFKVPHRAGLLPGTRVRIAVRPEWMNLFPADQVPAGENALTGIVEQVVYQGEMMRVIVMPAAGRPITVAVRNEGQLTRPLGWSVGDTVAACWRPEDAELLEEE